MSRIARRNIVPVNQITPLTYRDGVTYIQMLTELSEYIKSILHPSLQHTVDQLVSDVETQMDKHHDQYVDGVQEFQRIHDAFMSDVNAKLIALNDGASADLIRDETSLLSKVLRELFVQTEQLDNTVSEHMGDRTSSTRSQLDTIINNHPALDQVGEALEGVQEDFAEYATATDARLNQQFADLESRFDRDIEQIQDILKYRTAPDLSDLMAGGAMIVMVGSSTTTRDEYPQELARYFHNNYQPGVFRTLRRSSWGPTNNELLNTEFGNGVHVINAAWGGSVSGDYIDASIAQEISNLDPLIVFHSVGSNDFLQGIDPNTYQRNVERAMDMLTSTQPMWHVLVHQQERLSIRAGNPYVWDDYLAALYRIAEDRSRTIVIDAAAPLRNLGVGYGLSDGYDLMDDNVHLNSRGHKVLARIVAERFGLAGVGGVSDTGWQRITSSSEHVRMQIGGESSSNEPLMYRVVGDASGYTTYIRGLNTRSSTSGSRVTIVAIAREWRNALIPKTVFNPHDRHLVGRWTSASGRRNATGVMHIRQSGAIHAYNPDGVMGSDSIFVDVTIRA